MLDFVWDQEAGLALANKIGDASARNADHGAANAHIFRDFQGRIAEFPRWEGDWIVWRDAQISRSDAPRDFLMRHHSVKNDGART